MEGLFMHGAAHVFFEKKLEETEAKFNEQLKILEKKVKRELKEVTKVQNEQLGLIRKEIRALQHEVRAVRQSEEDLSQIGLDKLRKLSKNVEKEVHDIRKIKSEVKHLKTEIKEVKKVEEDISHNGMNQICNLEKRFSVDIHGIKSELDGIKEELSNVKEHENEDKEIKDLISRLHSKRLSQDYISSVFSKAVDGYFSESMNNGESEGQESLFSGSELGSSFTSSQESHIDSDEVKSKCKPQENEKENHVNDHNEHLSEECVEN